MSAFVLIILYRRLLAAAWVTLFVEYCKSKGGGGKAKLALGRINEKNGIEKMQYLLRSSGQVLVKGV